ncbi:MAG TPA: gas vesicle protein GvpD P-loop domain-containing protein [Nitrososphaeraceae archaeon]|nr:gas vesicle protein GvpD P-loop domain-containing protein [Nitrososphaeraceae archaeon]
MNKNYNISAKIPNELLQFLNNETYSLLVKGYSGVGKTTLCLTILKALNIKSNFFYISTRVSPNKLFFYFKWINKYLKIKHSNNHNKSSKDLISFEPFFEDARLDEPESLFERITNQLMDVRSPLIIVDSWDGIASFMDRESRLNNERVLQTWLERAGGRLILVSEGNEITTLDYLVDGIVTLKNSKFNNMNLREMHLTKLGGININKKSFLYTLYNGIFRIYEPYDDLILDQIHGLKNNTSKKIVKIDSGHTSMNNDLEGGFTKNSTVLLEYDFNLDIKHNILFLFNFFINSISNSHVVFLDNKIAENVTDLLRLIYLKCVNTKDYDRSIKIIDFHSNYDNQNNFNKTEIFSLFSKELKNTKSNSMLFSILNLDCYKNVDYFKLINFLRENMDLSYFVLQTGKSSEIDDKWFDYKIKISCFNDLICINLKKPYPRIYGFEIEKINNLNTILTRIYPLV